MEDIISRWDVRISMNLYFWQKVLHQDKKMKKLLFILISLLWFSSSAQITGDSTIVPNIAAIDSIVYSYVGVCQNQSTGVISINTYPTSNSYYYDWVAKV